MTALTSPHGPLPARVYWFRRCMVFSILFLLVFGTARLFGGGDSGQTPAATTVAAEQKKSESDEPKSTSQDDAPAVKRSAVEGAQAGAKRPAVGPSPSASPAAEPTPTEILKPEPTGVCSPADVMINPVAPAVRTSLKMTFGLMLSTKQAEACTFTVSPRTVAVKIDSGPRSNPDVIWQSQQCTDAITTQKVVVYRDHETAVPLTWSGRRSDADCSRQTAWAQRGWYHVQAAAYGGEPTDVQFELTRLSPVTVTRTVAPKPQKDEKSPSASPKPSGAVEPDVRD